MSALPSLRRGLQFACWLPPLYLVLAIQHGALTQPFWDHVELSFLFEKLYGGDLHFGDLLVPHNHSRPLVNRALLLANGWLTGWDVRSEYLYVIAAILGALLLHRRWLREALCDIGANGVRGPLLTLLFALFCCSPVGHNNHWWSQQLQLDLANVLIVGALGGVALRPGNWSVHVLAAALCWLATWTLSNGFVAFATGALLSQWTARSGRRPAARTLFWLGNLLLCAALYLPGLSEVGTAVRPTPLQLLDFATIYLGAPVAGLLWFPFHSMFDLPRHCDMNRTVGILLLLGAAGAVWSARARIAAQTPAARLFVAFAAFAVGSALMTAWGRATFDDYGVANANGSRFTIFSAHLPFALMFLAAGAAFPRGRRGLIGGIALLLFVAAATVSYWRGLVVYRDAHRFDRELARIYATGSDAELTQLHPNLEHAREVRRILATLRIGPFRAAAPTTSADLEALARGKAVDEFGIAGLRVDGEHGSHLFAQPHSVFRLPLAAGRYRVRCRCGVYAAAAEQRPPSDGVEFRIHAGHVPGSPVAWSRHIGAAAIAGGGETAIDFEVTFADHDSLIFETLAAGSAANDWAYWRELAVEPLPAR